jgi:hypothetical protein
MDDASKRQAANRTNDDLRRCIWLPLTVSGVGSALGALSLLLLFGAGRPDRVRLTILASAVNVLHNWLAPDFKSEIRLASGSRGEKVLEIVLQFAKRALYGIVVALIVALYLTCGGGLDLSGFADHQ